MISMDDLSSAITAIANLPSGSAIFMLLGAGLGGLGVLKTSNYIKGIVDPLDIKIEELEKDIACRLDTEQAQNASNHEKLKDMVENRLGSFKEEIFTHLDSHRDENIRLVESLSKNIDNLNRAILDIKSV